jgi:hypothetical protein
VTVSGEELVRRDTEYGQMQTTMEESGLDSLILAQALENFQNLCSVDIDVSSFQFSRSMEGLRCGAKPIWSSWQNRERPLLPEESCDYSRVYKLVFQVLASTGMHKQCTLGLHIKLRSSTEEVHQFDTDSALWKEKISPMVHKIGLSCATDTPWCQDVLKSVPNVEKF